MTTPLSSLFTQPELLTQALTHRSYCNEHKSLPHNERLEFLGDAVLSVIISARLYHLLPHQPEGELTSRRSYLVQTPSLAAKAKLLGLSGQILLSKGEEDSGGRENPGILANTFEAVLGALYLDSGFVACQDYLLEIFPDSDLTSDAITKDPKSLLQEKSQSSNWGTPSYTLLSASGPDHAKKFSVSVTLNDQEFVGEGTSKQRAQTQAASAALAKLFPS